jgi:hypothetical protein
MNEYPALVGANGPVLSRLIHEDEKVYHRRAEENLSSHQLKEFMKCPAHYHRKRAGLVTEPDRPAFLVGRAVHCLAIEGRAEFDRRFLVGGVINAKTGRAYGAGTKAHADWARQQTREVLSEEQAGPVESMAAAVQAHDLASRMFAGGVAEGVVRIPYEGVPCQIRIDYLHPSHGVIDLKTTESLDWFESDCRKYGYLHQLAFYRDVLAQAAGMPPENIPCRLVAVEKDEPYRCGVWLATAALLDDCAMENRKAIEELRQCRESGVWPTRYEEGRTIYA